MDVPRRRRFFLHAVAALASVFWLASAVDGTASPASRPAVRPLVPRGDLLVSDRRGRLLVLTRSGRVVRRLPRVRLSRAPEALELAPDRRHAFVSIPVPDRPARLYDVDLANGRKRAIAAAISPVLSPDRTRLAYVLTAFRANSDIIDRVALVVRALRTGQRHSIPLAPNVPLGTPPELVIGWSLDGRTIAVFDGDAIRLVNVGTATSVPSQPVLPGEMPTPGQTPSLAPVFLDARTLVVLTGCCIGPQQLVAVDLRSGARTRFATISSPAEQLERLKPGLLLTVTAVNELAIVSRGHVRIVARGVVAATG